MAQRYGEGAMPAHGMTKDRLPLRIGWEMLGDHPGQFFRDIAPHPVIAREWRFCGIDVKSCAKPEIVEARGIAGHISARAGVRRNKDQAQFGARLAIFALFLDVGGGAGEARQIPDHRELRAVLVRRHKDRKGHAGPGLAAGVLVDALHAIVRAIEGNGFDRHDFIAPAPRSDGIATAGSPGSVGVSSPTEPDKSVKPPWVAILPRAPRCDPSAPATDNHKAQGPVP